MKPTETLQKSGQSLWLDNITRSLLDSGAIARYIDRYSLTGLTSNPSINPSIFDKAIASGDYDGAMRTLAGRGLAGEELFFELDQSDAPRTCSSACTSASTPSPPRNRCTKGSADPTR